MLALGSRTTVPCAAPRVARASAKRSTRAVKCAATTPVESSRALAAAASTAALTLSASPAFAGDLFGPEYSGAVAVGGTIIVVGTGAIVALLLPFITGTLNPIQMLVNLTSKDASNYRKFKRNGEPMEHGVRPGHRWYKVAAYCNGKYIDFAGVSKSMEAEKKAKASPAKSR